MNISKRILISSACVAFAFASVACGGSKKSSSNPDGVAPPPKVGDGGAKKIDRKVTTETKKEFAAAVAFYNKQAKGGWTSDSCSSAAARFEDVAGDNPKLIEARFNAGVSYQNCGMDKKAEAQYKQALKLQAHGNSLANLGKIYWDRGNEKSATQYWQQATKADPKLASPRNNLAWLTIRKIRAMPKGADFSSLENEALGQLQRALAVENDNVEAYVLLALLYMEGSEKNRSRLDLARLLLDKAAEADKSFAPLWNARGLLLMRRENPAGALKRFAAAIKLDSKFSEAHLNAGNIVLDFRKYGEAAGHFGAVLERQPKNYEAAIGLGLAKRGLKDFAAAEASYNKANKISPKRGEAEFNLGILYMNFKASENPDETRPTALKKPYQTAISHFRKAVNKPLSAASLKKEANANIKLCEKQIKQIDDFAKSEAEFKAAEAKQKAADEARARAEAAAKKKTP